ncbi:hexose kinase [Chitinispirillales bacterium ANBcel5]|uniref:1-phosphofructokinase family hexose kinase n=1 Tax=Cellulosispirillum alkaliphilum TaxID=3039283 RepID=UPI002A518E1F|nr:hexose kinase [Chitinispirillales bacterium ANBcel5]
MIVCALFNPALDVCFNVEKFEPGNTLLDLHSNSFPSGKGINVARVVKTLGEAVSVAALIPENDSRKFSSFLCGLEVEPLFFEIPGNARVNVTILEEKNSCVTHLNSAAQKIPVRIQEEFLSFITGQIKQGDWWSFSGSIPSGFECDVYKRVIDVCNQRGVQSLLDTRSNALKFGLRSKPFIIKPNISELEEYFEEPIKGVHHIALKGKRFIDMGISYVFISLGSDGMIALHENDCLLCSPPKVKAVDTVGCGDAMVAGMLVAQKRKFSFADTCRMAVACGASKAMHQGPGVVTRDEVWQLMEDVEINAV